MQNAPNYYNKTKNMVFQRKLRSNPKKKAEAQIPVEKARETKVDLGFLVISGLMLPNGEYEIAVPQIAALFGTSKNYASQEFKRLLGEEFRPHKVSSDLTNAKVNSVPLSAVSKIAFELAKQGNVQAEAYLIASFEETIERRFDRAFEVQREEEERDERLKVRVERVTEQRRWTDCIKDYQEKRGYYLTEQGTKEFSQLAQEINYKLFQQPHFCHNRDVMNLEEQKLLSYFHDFLARQYRKTPDVPLLETVKRALEFYS